VLILDTGPLLAALDAADRDHAACAALLTEATEDLVVPGLVLGELDYWCAERLSLAAWLTFLDDVAGGAYRVQYPTLADLDRSRQLQATYADLRLGVVDATVVALAERLGEEKVAALDHRHFTVVRPVHEEALRLLP
jgi:uncharacterized protein